MLQDHEVIRLGGTRPRRVSVRIVASTNQNLERMVGSGTFRQDLFYRLNVVPLSIPPLRERREDTPFLLHHYLDIYNRKYGVRVRLGAEAVDRLCAYRWPGNVRELANLVERLVVINDDQVLTPDHLPKEYLSEIRGDDDAAAVKPLSEAVEECELGVIKNALSRSATLEEAAHSLGISISTLARRMRAFKIDRSKMNCDL